jgi:hypothetical protein
MQGSSPNFSLSRNNFFIDVIVIKVEEEGYTYIDDDEVQVDLKVKSILK